MTENDLPQDEQEEQQPPPEPPQDDAVEAEAEAPAEAAAEVAEAAEQAPSSIDDEVERQMLEELVKAEAADAAAAEGTSDGLTGATVPNIVADQQVSEQAVIGQAEFEDLPRSEVSGQPRNLEILMEVKLPIAIELGRTEMSIHSILELTAGSVVELNKLAGEPVDLLVNNKVVAKGEVVVVDENFGLRIISLISPEERIKAL